MTIHRIYHSNLHTLFIILLMSGKQIIAMNRVNRQSGRRREACAAENIATENDGTKLFFLI